MNWSLVKCLIYCILFLFISYSTWTLKMTCTYSSVMVPQLSLADVIRFSLPSLVIICCCLGGTRSGFPPLPLHAWGNHPTCLQWSHWEQLLLWTLLNHLVSEALALSTCVLLRRYLPCVFLCTEHSWIPSLEPDWVVRECIELKRVGSLEAHSPCML